jgi:predicted DNA-binding antitoxin AbrB/MazE fold protein
MKQTIDAVYEDGVFKPLKRLEIPDGQKVRLEIEAPALASPEDILDLATGIYDGLTEEEIDEIEKIALDRKHFFMNRDT